MLAISSLSLWDDDYALVGERKGNILFSPIFFFAKLQNVYNVYNSPISDQIVALDKLYILI